jgi:hypothetical protein
MLGCWLFNGPSTAKPGIQYVCSFMSYPDTASPRAFNVPSAQTGYLWQKSVSQRRRQPLVTAYVKQAVGHRIILIFPLPTWGLSRKITHGKWLSSGLSQTHSKWVIHLTCADAQGIDREGKWYIKSYKCSISRLQGGETAGAIWKKLGVVVLVVNIITCASLVAIGLAMIRKFPFPTLNLAAHTTGLALMRSQWQFMSYNGSK